MKLVCKLFFRSFATAVVACLLLTGTIYDFYLEYLKKKQLEMNCAHYNAKLDMTMPNSKRKNSKCGLYVVNNLNNNTENVQETNSNRPQHIPLASNYLFKLY